MKQLLLLPVFITCFFLNSLSQSAPLWTRDINALPDSASVYPVRTLTDATNHIFVLSTYYKYLGPGAYENKVYLRKYDESGNLAWAIVYDNNGSGQPRGFDMALDNSGNCLVAGGFWFPAEKPMLLKVSAAGSILWVLDSISTFQSGYIEQVIFQNNLIYLRAFNGIAVLDQNANELWGQNINTNRMAVDYSGQVIVSGYNANNETIFRFDLAGNLNFSDSSIYGKRIACDFENSFYLIEDYSNSGYALVKYDSAGTFQWSYTDFPIANPFGDIGYEVLVDYDHNVLVVGVNDTMFKFTPGGTVLWIKPMNGLDNYLISATTTFSNFLAVAGTIYGPNGNDMTVTFYNNFGNPAWSGYYSSNNGQQEFTVGMTIDNSGIYVIENNQQNTTLVKFQSPFSTSIDFNLICIDSVWYDTLNPNYIHVTVFNGNTSHVNYPTIQIISPSGDTIGNPDNWVSFFAHLGNAYQTYTDSITVTGIPDFHNYIFIMNEGLWDTSGVIGWCNTSAVSEYSVEWVDVYPNPVSEMLYIKTGNSTPNMESAVCIFNVTGELVYQTPPLPPPFEINVSSLPQGVYFLRMNDGNKMMQARFCKL